MEAAHWHNRPLFLHCCLWGKMASGHWCNWWQARRYSIFRWYWQTKYQFAKYKNGKNGQMYASNLWHARSNFLRKMVLNSHTAADQIIIVMCHKQIQGNSLTAVDRDKDCTVIVCCKVLHTLHIEILHIYIFLWKPIFLLHLVERCFTSADLSPSACFKKYVMCLQSRSCTPLEGVNLA